VRSYKQGADFERQQAGVKIVAWRLCGEPDQVAVRVDHRGARGVCFGGLGAPGRDALSQIENRLHAFLTRACAD